MLANLQQQIPTLSRVVMNVGRWGRSSLPRIRKVTGVVLMIGATVFFFTVLVAAWEFSDGWGWGRTVLDEHIARFFSDVFGSFRWGFWRFLAIAGGVFLIGLALFRLPKRSD